MDNKLIDLNGLSTFRTKYDEVINGKIPELVAGDNITITQSGNEYTISSTGGGGSEGVIVVLQSNEPSEYTAGMVWIDGGSESPIYTKKIEYTADEPTDLETGLGWVG